VAPEEVESLLGVAATKKGTKGLPVKPRVKTILKRSYVLFSISFDHDCRFNEMVSTLLKHMGGMANVLEVRDKIHPEFIEINFFLPIKGSEEQENGSLSPATLTDLCQLRASLAFEFV